jgi:hypothetical protein
MRWWYPSFGFGPAQASPDMTAPLPLPQTGRLPSDVEGEGRSGPVHPPRYGLLALIFVIR